MPTIKQLDPHIANLIAAGEVVERPSSVVKELMENAIDAGAAHLTVEISHGGMSLIRVTDDGCGIAANQAHTAFLRHATSKISNEYDLEAIGTLGFRGEALAAIAAVSRVELLTRTTDSTLGTALTLEGGTVVQQEEAGCPSGTTLVVRDLFFNTPARLKFMKRDQAEGAAVFAVVQREALSHPEVAVKFIRDGKQEFLTPGDAQLKSVLYAVFGRDIALGFTPVKSSGDGMEVGGFVSLPTCCRASRSYQHFFVNGRYVKSRLMQTAVEEAYKNQKMVGKFPGCVLHFTCKLNSVDVNVHPTKIEVKFAQERQIFSFIYHAVRSTLERDYTRPSALVGKPKTPNIFPQNYAPSSMPKANLETAKQALILNTPVPPLTSLLCQPSHSIPEPIAVPYSATLPHQPRPGFRPAARAVNIAPPGDDFDQVSEKASTTPVQSCPPLHEPPSQTTFISDPSPQEPEPTPQSTMEPESWVIRGELFLTYILVEQGETVLLIDKHAAHERMNFDRLRSSGYAPMVQQLLSPLTFTPSPEERAILLAYLPLLEEFGFCVEEFGPNALLVRHAPDDVEEAQIESTLIQLAQRLLITGTADPAGARDELLHTMACKAAIKGGWKNGLEELEAVTRAVMNGSVKYCPHGRPIVIEMSKKQLEKQFKRI